MGSNGSRGVARPARPRQGMDCTILGCDVCQRLENLQKCRMRGVHGTQHNLAQQQIALKTLRNASHDRLGSKLPFELISGIFSFVHEPDNYSTTQTVSSPDPPLTDNYPPALLSSVCRRWREIALALPELWANVYINLGRKFDHRDVTEEWLNRSRPMPLNLTLAYVDEYNELDDGTPMTPNLYTLLRSHSARWEYLDIRQAPDNTLYMLFNDLENMPTSKFLHLRMQEFDQGHRITIPTPLRPGRMSIFFINPNFATVIPLGWDNLTHLEIDSHPMHILLDIISKAPKLKHCVSNYLNPPTNNEIENSPIIPVIHDSLEWLELTLVGAGIEIFRYLTLPCLRHLKSGLHLYNFSRAQDIQFVEMIDFLARSKLDDKVLQTFSLEYRADDRLADYANHSRFLELTAAMTHLSIDIWEDFDEDVHPLLLKLSDITFCPRLQELRIKLMESNAMGPSDWAVLCEFITKHNSSAKNTDINTEEDPSSSTSPLQNKVLPKNAPSLKLSSIGRQHRRSLGCISISANHSRFRMKMKKTVFLCLRKAQKAGPLKLEIRNAYEDVLQKQGYARNDVLMKDVVVLNFEP